MTVAKIFGAFLMTLILGMSFGAIDTAEAKKDRGTPGRHTMRCPGPANWRLPSHISTEFQKSGSGCIKKGTTKSSGVGYYQQCEARKKCGVSNFDCAYHEGRANYKYTARQSPPLTCK
jgi:hypothetical protein